MKNITSELVILFNEIIEEYLFFLKHNSYYKIDYLLAKNTLFEFINKLNNSVNNKKTVLLDLKLNLEVSIMLIKAIMFYICYPNRNRKYDKTLRLTCVNLIKEVKCFT